MFKRLSTPTSASNSMLSELIDERSWDEVLLRLKTNPDEASKMIMRGGYGKSLPLHEACKLQPPTGVVKALIDAYKQAASTEGLWAFLPLHFAVRSNSVEASVTLLEAYPDAARKKESKGKLPLHLACQWGASPDVVDRLLMSYPESIYDGDDDGKLPMDHAEGMKAHTANRTGIIAVLECGPAYCAVSQAGT